MSNNDNNCLQIVLPGPSLQQQKFYDDSSKDAQGVLHKF